MNQGPDEQLTTPLEDALLSLPQEEPPADLQANCLTALDEASLKTGPRLHWEPWRQFAAAAAVLVMIIGAGNLMMSGAREKARDRMVRSEEQHRKAVASLPAMPAPGAWREGGKGGAMMAGGPGGPPSAGPAAPGGPGGPPQAPGAYEPTSQLPAKPTQVQGWFGQTPPQVKMRMEQESRQPSGVRSTAAYEQDALKPAPAAPAPTVADSTYRDRAVNRPAQPWEDQSDTRRKVTERTIEVETPAVEETYKQAVTLIEKAGGYVTQEDLTVRRHGGSQAHLDARIPVAQFDGVISQVRDLGRLVVMTGQSQDETEDYQTEGAGIRELGAREEDLAARYNQETDKQKKARLGLELQSVRHQLVEAKRGLKTLHKATSYAQLSLTISEAKGLRAIVKNAAEEALPLAFSLALIAFPLLVLALIWKRRR